jgi:hypothetical protein
MALITFFGIGCLMSVQTTEAWYLGLAAQMTPDATIIAQVPQFFDGSLPAQYDAAFCVAFGIQAVLLMTKLGLSTVHAFIEAKSAGEPTSEAMKKAAKTRGGIWDFAQWTCLLINAWADLVYTWQLGWWQALVFGGVMFVLTFYFGTWGMQCVAYGMGGSK